MIRLRFLLFIVSICLMAAASVFVVYGRGRIARLDLALEGDKKRWLEPILMRPAGFDETDAFGPLLFAMAAYATELMWSAPVDFGSTPNPTGAELATGRQLAAEGLAYDRYKLPGGPRGRGAGGRNVRFIFDMKALRSRQRDAFDWIQGRLHSVDLSRRR